MFNTKGKQKKKGYIPPNYWVFFFCWSHLTQVSIVPWLGIVFERPEGSMFLFSMILDRKGRRRQIIAGIWKYRLQWSTHYITCMTTWKYYNSLNLRTSKLCENVSVAISPQDNGYMYLKIRWNYLNEFRIFGFFYFTLSIIHPSSRDEANKEKPKKNQMKKYQMKNRTK